MRRKIALALLVVFLSSAAGVTVAVLQMSSSTRTLRHLLDLHQIEELRKHLIIAVQTAQADLFTVRTELGKQVDVITDNVAALERAAETCRGCHHVPTAAARIERVGALVSAYQEQLSFYITASANGQRIAHLKHEAAATGADLLRLTEEMSFDARSRLERMTSLTLTEVDRAQKILLAATLAALLLMVAAGVWLAASITRPIEKLVRATRALASGDLGYTLALDDRTEFGELAAHFDSMSGALARGYQDLQAQIQERRQAEAALRVSEERLRLALEATSEVVWDWNVADDTIYHPRWAEAYGYPADAAPRTGEDLALFVHPEERRLFREELTELLAGARAVLELEHRVKTGSGDWRWMRTRARVVERDGDGKAFRVVGTSADVTERRRMLERFHLADRLASIGTLAAGVAHEMNNPLAYVLANVGHALQELRKWEQAGGQPAQAAGGGLVPLRQLCQALEEAEIGASRVRDIVRELRVFSRVDEDVRGPADVNRALREAIHFAEPTLRHRARLHLELQRVPLVAGSESRLTQVFVNLLVNAAQAIPEGNPERNQIRVRTRQGQGRVVVEVQDSGCGIPAEHLKRLFDPFFTTKPVGTGTGLGLAICHGIVTSAGGDIEVESEPGRGALFRVRLRPAEAEARPELPPAPKRPARRGRILVVDDEPLFVRATERLLGAEHEVVSLTDPREALRRIEAGECFDLVVSDLVMPEMSGVQLRSAIGRVVPRLAEHMLFVTGGGSTAAAADFVERWRDRVLEKPLSAEALRAAILDALERSASAPSTP